MSLADSIERARKSVVRVSTGGGQGSGVVVQPNLILTNEHVVSGVLWVSVIDDSGVAVAGQVILREKSLDLAVLSVADQNWPAIEIGDLASLREGDEVIALGHPLGLSYTVTRGIVSTRAREYQGQTYIQTDAAINPGNSGGPLLDTAGRLLGINTFLLKGGYALNFAIPIDRALTAIAPALQSAGGGAPAASFCFACTNRIEGVPVYCPVCGVRLRTESSDAALEEVVPARRVATSTSGGAAAVACTACGSVQSPGETYCNVCGKNLRG